MVYVKTFELFWAGLLKKRVRTVQGLRFMRVISFTPRVGDSAPQLWPYLLSPLCPYSGLYMVYLNPPKPTFLYGPFTIYILVYNKDLQKRRFGRLR